MPDSMLILATVLFSAFAFTFGACFGSFLNVVVWRMPRKIPIAWTRSHCPKCQHELLGRDNIPLFGWWKLKGKCRFCALPISPRYPLVEGGIALLFFGLFLLIVVSHGATLPVEWMPPHFANWLTEFPACPLLIVYLHQIVLGYFLVALFLIDEDRQLAPWSLILFALVVHAGLLAWEPALSQINQLSQQFVAAEQNLRGPHVHPRADWQGGLQSSLYGGLLATLLAGGGRIWNIPHQTRNSWQALLLIGTFLGPLVLLWATMVAASSLGFQWLTGKMTRGSQTISSGFPLQLFLAWLLILATWRWWPPLV